MAFGFRCFSYSIILSAADRSRLLARSGQDIEEAVPRVRPILEAVRARGDAALVEYSRTFDAAEISGLPLRVGDDEIAAAERGLDGRVKDAIRACVDNVRRCHETQLPEPMERREIRPGVRTGPVLPGNAREPDSAGGTPCTLETRLRSWGWPVRSVQVTVTTRLFCRGACSSAGATTCVRTR